MSRQANNVGIGCVVGDGCLLTPPSVMWSPLCQLPRPSQVPAAPPYPHCALPHKTTSHLHFSWQENSPGRPADGRDGGVCKLMSTMLFLLLPILVLLRHICAECYNQNANTQPQIIWAAVSGEIYLMWLESSARRTRSARHLVPQAGANHWDIRGHADLHAVTRKSRCWAEGSHLDLLLATWQILKDTH